MQRVLRRSVLSSLALGLFAATAAAQPLPFENEGVMLPPAIEGFAAADLDRDGLVDLVLPGSTDPGRVWRGDEALGFIAGRQTFERLRSQPIVADFDGDGALDVFGRQGAGGGQEAGYALWRGPLFARDETVDTRPGLHAIAVDVDVDGDPDVVTVSGAAIGAYLNDGRGTFTWSGALVGESADGLAAGDVDADGDPDLVVGGRTGWSLWLNQGFEQGGAPGTFAGPASTGGAGSALRTPSLADIDGDADLDLYVASDPLSGTQADSLWINQGGRQGGSAGAFLPSAGQVLPAEGTGAVDFGDADGDGDADLLLAVGQALELWTNQGGAQGGEPGRFSLAARTAGLADAAQVALLPPPVAGTGRAVACCDAAFATAVFTAALPDFSLSAVRGLPLSIDLGSVKTSGCAAARTPVESTEFLALGVEGRTELELALEGDPGPVTVSPLGRVPVERSLLLTVTCDGLGEGVNGFGVRRTALVATDRTRGETVRIPIRCRLAGPCPTGDPCECEDRVCCGFICAVFWFFTNVLNFGVAGEPALDGPKLLGESEAATRLRAFRDGPMSADPVWAYYRRRFEAATPAIIEAVARDIDFSAVLNVVQSPWVLALDTLTRGAGDTAVVTPAMEQSLNRVLDFLERRGSPGLAREVAAERERLSLDQIAGLSLEDFYQEMSARGSAVGDIIMRSGFEL